MKIALERKTSFDVAERKLGLNVVPFDASTSSINKGESLYDTVKNSGKYRSTTFLWYDILWMITLKELENIKGAIVNGGDGTGNHPSQWHAGFTEQSIKNLENLKGLK